MNHSTPGLPVHHQLRSSPRLTSIESVMPSSHLILCHPLLLLPPVPPSIRVFSNESTLRMRWPKYWSFSFSIRTPLWFSNSIYGKISEGNENTKANIHLIPMFITLLTTTAKLRKHPVFINRWNDKKEVVFIHTREYYKKKKQKKKKKEFFPFVTMWMDLEGIMISEVRQRKINTVWSHLHVAS